MEHLESRTQMPASGWGGLSLSAELWAQSGLVSTPGASGGGAGADEGREAAVRLQTELNASDQKGST